MTIRAIDLSGRYLIASVTASGGGGTIKLTTPGAVNPNWLQGDLAGVGSALATQNINMVYAPSPLPVLLDGQYTLAAVAAGQITFASPTGVTTDWNKLPAYQGGQTLPLSATISLAGASNWIGPFIVENPNTAFLVANVIALQGLYKDDGKSQTPFPISFEVEATPVNTLDVPIGAPQTFVGIVDGNPDKSKDLRAKTLICSLATPGRQSVRARRTTDADYVFKGTVVDEIKWQDLFGMGPVDQPDFGNVTTVRSRTFATQGALSVKERKLNMLVTRRIPLWTGGITFSANTASSDAAEIVVELCRDELIGGRTLDEIDIASIHDAVAEAGTYFGDAAATAFGFTFDDDNTSFEESVRAVSDAVFCVPYRQGSKIKMIFEGPTRDSTMLFNHRNKVPGSETRTVSFGIPNDNDGIELEYVDTTIKPSTDSPATIYIPADRSAKKPMKITAHGVRSFKQAYWIAWRSYNKLVFQNTVAEFEALQEAAPSIRGERILVADNTRADTQDGEVVSQIGLTLTLSQPVDLTDPAGHTLFLQLPDATIDAIPVVAGVDADQVVLARAPRVALALDEGLYARATYQLVVNKSARSSAFLLIEKDAQDSGSYQLRAVNYSSLYYQGDTLQLWLTLEDAAFSDHSAYERDGVPAGGATTVADGTRGTVYSGAAGRSVTFPAFNPPAASYTKAAWVKRGDLVTAGALLEGAHETFGFAAGNLQGGHDGVQVSAPWPDAVNWHHAALVWDEAGDTMSLYLDAELVSTATGGAVGPRALAQLTAFAGLVGRAGDLRLINRALADDEVLELYRATRI